MDLAPRTVRIGLAGVGVVGQGLVRFLQARPDFAPAGGTAVITGVSARDRTRVRDVPLEDYAWFDDPVELALSDDNDVFIELIGGSEGPARLAVEAALSKGKPVITAERAGWRGDAIEAEAFAYLAARTLKGLPISYPGTTGVGVPMSGGQVVEPGAA